MTTFECCQCGDVAIPEDGGGDCHYVPNLGWYCQECWDSMLRGVTKDYAAYMKEGMAE